MAAMSKKFKEKDKKLEEVRKNKETKEGRLNVLYCSRVTTYLEYFPPVSVAATDNADDIFICA